MIQVVGFEKYMVTDDGRVYSKADKKFMKQFTTSKGYKRVCLWDGKKPNTRFVHTLVLEAFFGLRPKGTQCGHLDGDPANNHISNLKWVTPKENGEHRIAHGKSRTDIKINNAIVRKIRSKELAHLNSFEVAAKFGIAASYVRAIRNGNAGRLVSFY
jgi:hypothetical protein